MSTSKQIVCLANSRKYQGCCIAGKEVEGATFGAWIRPISGKLTGELANSEIKCTDGKPPRVLDLVTIPLAAHKPHIFQTENYLIDPTKRWVKKGQVGQERLPQLCDRVSSLWVDGYSSANGINDRVPLEKAEREVKSSLLMVKPIQLRLKIGYEGNTRKIRAGFEHNGTSYLFAVTDFAVESYLLWEKDGIYPLKGENIYLCVSLGEPFGGFTYKLVAAVINSPLARHGA